jgi:type IV secretory pathway TrbF-like protein
VKNSEAKTGSKDLTNPYLVARRDWDERYGSFVTRARNWRAVAVLSLLVAIAEAAGMVSIASRTKTVPYIVAVDSLAGRVLAAGPADQGTTVNDNMKRAALHSWIEDLRFVTSDPSVQRRAIDHVYSMVAKGSAAQTFLTEWYRNNQPFERHETTTVAVEVHSLMATSDRTYEVEWTESARTLSGEPVSTETWKGVFTIAVNAPTEERLIRINPLGIYVTDATWSKVL